jgi:hypothetical protein
MRKNRSIPGLSLGALAALVLLGGGTLTSARAAEPPVTVENIRVGFEERYKIGTWTPVWVDLKGGKAPFDGYLEVIVPDDDGTPTSKLTAVRVETNGFATFVTYVRPGARNGDMLVRVLDTEGRRQTRDIDATERNGKSIDVLDSSQTVLALIGNPRGVDEIANLAGFSNVTSGVQNSELVVVRLKPEAMPARGYGYDAANVIVLDTSDSAVLGGLDRVGVGLQQWVRNGGHLVVAVQSNWQRVKQSVLGDMLPAVPVGTKRLNDLGAIEAFAGSSSPIPSKDLTVTVFEGARRSGILCETTSAPPTPIVVRGAYGFGRVTVVGMDVDGKPFSDWKDKPLFWVKALDLHGRGDQPQAAPGSTAFFQNTASDLASLLHRSLEQFTGVKLVPFGWVAFFVFLYILLIGPGDYFFLKKVVKRMELTWITFPLIVLTVSLVAYGAAYAVKGTDLRVNKADLLDVDMTTGLARGTTWATIFSPQNRDYNVSLVPVPLDRAPGSEPPAKAPAGTETILTWFGTPDPRFGGNNANRLNLSGSGYRYDPPGQSESLDGVRVPIWSTKSLTGRWLAPAGNPPIQADLAPAGTDRLTGTITNLTQRRLRSAMLVVGRQVYAQLGDLAPGASVRIDASSRIRPLSGYLEEHSRNFQNAINSYNSYNADDTQAANLQRPDLLRCVMFRDSLGGKSPLHNLPLHDLDLSGQLGLERPMFVAEVDAPVCALRLAGAAVTPKVDQVTILRVILPEPADPHEKPAKPATAKP